VHWLAFTVLDGRAAAEVLLQEKFADVGGWSAVQLPHGGYGYRESLIGSFNTRLYYGADRPEAFVIMTGAVCDQLPAGVISQFLHAAANGRMRLRRIDIAFDGLVDLDGKAISPRALFERVRVDRSILRTWANRDSICYHETLEAGGGETIDIGARSSERYVRIYNRRGLTRLELELKGQRAEMLPKKWANAPVFFGAFAVGMLRDFLDFVESSKRPNTAPLQPWWAAMVERFERIPMRIKPGEITVDGRWEWLKRQTSASLLMIIRASGGESEKIIERLIEEGNLRFSGRHEAFLAAVPKDWKPT